MISGAAAKVAGETVADFFFGRVGVLFQQALGGDEQSRRANAALQRDMFDELALQDVQVFAVGHAFDGFDLGAVYFNAQNEAGANDTAIDGDAAGTTVAGRTAFLRAGQVQLVAEYIQQALGRLAKDIDFIPIDRGLYVMFGH